MHNHGFFGVGELMKQVGMMGIQRPVHHGLSHDRKTGQKIMNATVTVSHREARNFIESVRNDLRALRKFAHLQTMQIVRLVEVRLDTGFQ